MSADAGQFGEFVRQESGWLLHQAWLLTGDTGLGEDLVQDVLLRAWSRWLLVSRADSPRAYVQKMMLRQFLRHRLRWRGERLVTELAESDYSAAAVDTRLEVEDMLQSLPRRQRAVVVLRYLCDMSEVDTARALNCSVGTIKSQTSRALAALRIEYGQNRV